MSARPKTRAFAAAALAVAALAPASAEAASPTIEQIVVAKSGSAKQKRVVADSAVARVAGKRCAVAAGTPLAALIRSGVGPLRLHDYGSCSNRPADAADLYVRAIAGDRARGQNGWVYKVGNKVGTAGAGDPRGPFGRGRLREGQRVMWFYCRLSARTGACQRTLGVKASAEGGGTLRVTVRAYNDRGRSKLRSGATVHAGDTTAKTGSDGTASFQLPAGRTKVWASAKGVVRSFEEAVEVR
jgi:hypothetical protein